jgi:hypothetical protein
MKGWLGEGRVGPAHHYLRHTLHGDCVTVCPLLMAVRLLFTSGALWHPSDRCFWMYSDRSAVGMSWMHVLDAGI